jgi:hypothetical protein
VQYQLSALCGIAQNQLSALCGIVQNQLSALCGIALHQKSLAQKFHPIPDGLKQQFKKIVHK